MAAAESEWLALESETGALTFDPTIGNLRRLVFTMEGRCLAPLNTAYWVGEARVAHLDLAPVERSLAGDFFCAPFGASDVEPAPPHGWTANSGWTITERAATTAALRLDRAVLGATVEKRLHLGADTPLLYQRHTISGGTGGLPVAHHAMARATGGGRLDTSPKRCVMTPNPPLEAGFNHLAQGAQTADLAAVPTAEGGTCDLHRVPLAEGREDFAILVEAPGNALGWTSLIRKAEDDIVLVLKSPDQLPVTCLWLSNGGRDYPPWDGQHTNVVGIEDARTAGPHDHSVALAPSPLSRLGIPTTLDLAEGRRHTVGQIIGAIPRPPGWREFRAIAAVERRLVLTEASGDARTLPFDHRFLAGERA